MSIQTENEGGSVTSEPLRGELNDDTRRRNFCAGFFVVVFSLGVLLSLVAKFGDSEYERPRTTDNADHRRPENDSSSSPSPLSTLKFMQYNIDGGGGVLTNDTDRYGAIIDWIKMQDADVVGLCELNGWEQPPGMYQRARSAGFEHAFLYEDESGYNLGIMSRFPITIIEATSDGFERGIIHAKIAVEEAEWHVFVVHMNAHDAIMRLDESKRISDKISAIDRPNRNDRIKAIPIYVVVMGDFNTLSPDDADLYDHEHLKAFILDGSMESRLAKKLLVGKDIFYAPFEYFTKQAGMTDPCVERWSFCGPTEPTAVSLDQISTDDDRTVPGMRLDYILVEKNSVASTYTTVCTVLRRVDVASLSDHFPVACAFVPVTSN